MDNLGSSASTVTRLRTWGPKDLGSLFSRSNNFISYLNRPYRYSGPRSHLPVVYIEPYFRGCSGQGVKLTSHVRLVPSLRITGVIILLLHLPSWSAHGLIRPATPDKILHVSLATPPHTTLRHVRPPEYTYATWYVPSASSVKVRSAVVCSNLTPQTPSPTNRELFSSRTD